MRRRDFLGAASAVALSGGVAAAQPARWSSGSAPPALHAPPGTTDCHHYVYNPRYPVASRYISHPDDANPDDYRGLMHRLGITRHVLVQPSTYGTDNRAMLDALKVFGAEARGIAVVAASAGADELKQLDGLGVRGVRINFAPAGPVTPAMIEPLARRIEPLGWHVELNAWARDLAAMTPFLEHLPTPIALDHFGHIPEPEGASDLLYAQVLRLVDKGKAWVKLAAPYDASKVGAPGYADSSALARAYVKAAPERLIWGTNWPHPGENAKPDDAQIFDLLADWAPDAAIRNRILVDNPQVLYGFPSSA